MSTALVLIDIQNDYFPGGRMELSGSIEASFRAGEILAFFREKKMPVIHIRHISTRPGAAFFLPGTVGSEIHEHVQPHPDEPVIEKNYPNSFRGTPLLDQLGKQDIRRLAIAGMMTHMCVDATTRAAFDLGFECTIVHDACATKDLAFGDKSVAAAQVQAAFLAALNGVYARVASAKEFVSHFPPPL